MSDILVRYPEVSNQIDKAIKQLQDLKKVDSHLCDIGCVMAFIGDDLRSNGEKAVTTFYTDKMENEFKSNL